MAVPYKPKYGAAFLLKLATEIAMEVHDEATILKMYEVSAADYRNIKKNPAFLKFLQSAQADWNSSLNAEARVKIKGATMVEGWLEEANKRLHDDNETLTAKTELAKLISRLAGQGFTTGSVDGGAEKVSISINLGGPQPVQIDAQVTPKVTDV